jgi:predicted ATP-binding protein involved in virulence
MHLQRVQVPNFRALKNIDITFEKERIPRIFPLASLNGGGKSTLLQLVFALLTCSTNQEKHQFLRNLLKDFEIDVTPDNILAKIDLADGDNTINIEFYCYTTSDLTSKFLVDSDVKSLSDFSIGNYPYFFSKINHKIQSLNEDISKKNTEEESINEKIEFKKLKILRNEQEEQSSYYQEQSIESRQISREREFESENLLEEIRILEEKCKEIIDQIEDLNSVLYEQQDRYSELEIASTSRNQIIDGLKLEGVTYICSCCFDNETNNQVNLLCRITGDEENKNILEKVSKKIFLAAPESQVFLFFSRQDIDCLFENRNSVESYESIIQKNQNKLSGFFLYDFSMIKILAEAFSKARHNDWQQAIRTRGQYGNEYARISKDLEYVFSGKIIEPLEDLSGIVVKTIDNSKERVLHPEDLSHGELRRLTFYAWLRTKEIQDSIVLIDEIEIGLHPDWQYQIVKDLEDWAPSNQYILATHSYEICSALTPAHVKEIEPKLIKPLTAPSN